MGEGIGGSMTGQSHSLELHEGGDIKALLEMARALAATDDLDHLLQMVVDFSIELLDAERATLFLYDASSGELYSRIAKGVDGIRIPVTTGIAGAAATSRTMINIPDAYQDSRFNREVDKRTGFRTRSILACPLIDYDDQLVGVLQILNKKKGVFVERDVTIAEALSAQAGVALQRAALMEHYLEKKQLEQALQIARDIQQQLFPQTSPTFPGFDIFCWNRPCDQIGGDCADFMETNGDTMHVLLGDVSGHGVGPALISCATRAMFRGAYAESCDCSGVINQVNSLLTADLSDNRFVTAFLGRLTSSTGELNFFSAGQGPLLLFHAGSGEVDLFGADGIPLGIIGDFQYGPANTIAMQPGDIFAIFSDGFYEWARSDGEQFGSDRVIELLKQYHGKAPHEMIEIILHEVETFADTPQSDDLTGVMIKKQ